MNNSSFKRYRANRFKPKDGESVPSDAPFPPDSIIDKVLMMRYGTVDPNDSSPRLMKEKEVAWEL